jgi:fumarate hydratase class II
MTDSVTPRVPAAIAHDADRTGSTLREAARRSGDVSREDFDRIVDPAR